MYIYIHQYEHIQIHLHLYKHVYIYIYTYTHTNTYVKYVYICTCIRISWARAPHNGVGNMPTQTHPSLKVVTAGHAQAADTPCQKRPHNCKAAASKPEPSHTRKRLA